MNAILPNDANCDTAPVSAMEKATSHKASTAVELPDDEHAIRRAIHDLGSHDFEVRAIARTYVLSAGDAAVPILMAELSSDKQRSRARAQLVALLVAVLVIAGPALGAFFQLPWLFPATNISACAVLLVACMLFTRPAWYAEASKLLAKFDGPEVTRAMIEALTDVWGEEQPRLRAAIIERLKRVRPEDESWLRGETRDRVIALLSMPNWSSATCVDDVLTIARALASIGATEAIPVLKGENCASLQGERRERLEKGLADVIEQLEELEARNRSAESLLRPGPQDDVALVRPAAPGTVSGETALLRASAEEETSTER